ncbi:MAG TPA: FHA domain-containing protein, partial [Ktedonobacterales bacterium]
TTPENNELPRAERSTAPMGLHGTQQSSRLVILQGKWPGRIYRIYKASITIGRNKESDIILEESNVSRKHATIYQTADNEYWIRDEDSTNGMMVNGYRRSACLLQDGDDIEIGETILRFFC